MSTLDLIKTQNEHRTNTFFEKGEEATKLTMKEAFHRAQNDLVDVTLDIIALDFIYKKGE